MAGLNPKQARFVEEYLVDLNATQAYVRAGYTTKSANVCAVQLLANPKIQAAIAVCMAERAKRTEITQDKVLTDVELIKRDAMRDKTDKDGNVEMSNHAAALKACELQGRHLRMWNDKLDITATVSIADAIRDRIAKRGA